jgi:hypothetical protein
METMTPCKWPLGPANYATFPSNIEGRNVLLVHLSNYTSFVLMEKEHEHHSSLGNQKHQGHIESEHNFLEQRKQQCHHENQQTDTCIPHSHHMHSCHIPSPSIHG